MELHCAQKISDVFKFIMEYMNTESIDDDKKQQFIDWYEDPTMETDLFDLMEKSSEYIDLCLQFIGFDEGRFQIINKYTINTNQKQKSAFIVLNGDSTMCGPLFFTESNGEKQTAFSLDDMRVNAYVEKYIDKLNQTDWRKFPRIEENPNLSTNGSQADPISISTMDQRTGSIDPLENVMDIDLSGDQTIPMSSSTEITYDAPIILNQPKRSWKGRYPSDLVPKKKSTSKRKRINVGLLQGSGKQRSLVQIKVPTQLPRKTVYVGVTTRTVNNEPHAQKVIVPGKTKVNNERLNHENKLNYLDFSDCHSSYDFDESTRTVYMEITSTDYKQKIKEIPTHMFNLYQNAQLTKFMIERQQLDKCQLAFWFCIKQNDEYVAKSRESLSDVISDS